MNRIIRVSIVPLLLLGVIGTASFTSSGLDVQEKSNLRNIDLYVACANSLDDCPEEGCGAGGDPFLNRMKNRVTIPDDGDVQTRSLSAIRRLRQPVSWVRGSNRASLSSREETPVVIQGYMKVVKPGGKETCNCGLSGAENADLHLVIVSAKTGRYSIEASSVTAEVTPRIRKLFHPTWTLSKIRTLTGKKVRLTGWLLLDTQHIRRPLVRSTNWELHPITKIEVMTDGAWEEVL